MNDFPDPKNVYEKRIVAFLDILGFENLVKTGKVQEILAVTTDLEERFSTLEKLGKPIELSVFSDSIFLSDRISGDGFSVIRLIEYVRHIAAGLFWKGILCRGGILIDQVYHKNPIAFGPALIKAHYMENKIAVYPRILAEPDVITHFLNYANSRAKLTASAGKNGTFRTDFDGMEYLELFGPNHLGKHADSGLLTDTIYRPAWNIISKKLSECDDTRVRQKLVWFKNYLDASEKDFGNCRITVNKH
ncbi:MAG TPA: hypothetical protein ENI79_04925 [Rhodospirillales bacterium]|nr:hypothetical protein [Rhodospirillales bacterium]